MSRWIAAVAIVALGVGVTLAVGQWSPRQAGRPSAPDGILPGDTSSADPGNDADEKSRWIDEVQEVDLGALGPARREIFLRHANAQRCTCGCGYTLAACRVYDSSCDRSLPRVQALFDSVARGWIADAAGLRERPADSAPAAGSR